MPSTHGRPLAATGGVVKAAEELRERGAQAVLAGLGADGRLLVDATGTWVGHAAATALRSNVGA